MQVTLTGPDELGYWFLTDENGNAFPLVEKWSDLPAAAEMFGWKAPEGVEDTDDLAENAQQFLLDCISDEIEAPADVEEYFRKLYGDE